MAEVMKWCSLACAGPLFSIQGPVLAGLEVVLVEMKWLIEIVVV